MDEFKGHTPGPWAWKDNWLSAPGTLSVIYYTTDDDGIHADNPADRALLAAAPTLLAERDMHKRHAAELLDLFASLPAVPADAQETVDQIQRERDQA
ncbi:MAG: hypothetical protein AAGI72_06610 [Pseudomonadota bacterium]